MTIHYRLESCALNIVKWRDLPLQNYVMTYQRSLWGIRLTFLSGIGLSDRHGYTRRSPPGFWTECNWNTNRKRDGIRTMEIVRQKSIFGWSQQEQCHNICTVLFVHEILKSQISFILGFSNVFPY